MDLIEGMREAIDKAVANPGPYHTEYAPKDGRGRFFGDHYMYRRFDEFRNFTFQSPAAEIAARVTRSSQVNFFYDQLFVKEGGTGTAPIPWHQDMGYWGIDGEQVVTVWVPFDAMEENQAVEFIRGSHVFDGRCRYQPRRFLDGKPFSSGISEALVDMPDLGAARSADGKSVELRGKKQDILRFAVEPGDVLVFNAWILHGNAGNTDNGKPVRRLALRWAGDDATFIRKQDSSVQVPLTPPEYEMPWQLQTGQPIREDPRAFPVGWGMHKEYIRSHPSEGIGRWSFYAQDKNVRVDTPEKKAQ